MKRRHRFRQKKNHFGHYNNGKIPSNKFDAIDYHNVQNRVENILRIIGESNLDLYPICNLSMFCKNSKHLGRYLNILQNDEYLSINNGIIKMTEFGKQEAKKISIKHQTLEYAFETELKTFSPHKIADILEHSLSEQEINNVLRMKQQNKIRSYSLYEFRLPSATVYNLKFNSEKLFYKILSLGIYPSQRIEILQRNGNNLIIRVKGGRFAIDKKIAQCIQVIP